MPPILPQLADVPKQLMHWIIIVANVPGVYTIMYNYNYSNKHAYKNLLSVMDGTPIGHESLAFARRYCEKFVQKRDVWVGTLNRA